MDQEVLCQIIAILLYKLGEREIVLTQNDLEETLRIHDSDRLVMQGIGHEMRIGLYNKYNHPKRLDIVQSFH
jgi:hypothetical protein